MATFTDFVSGRYQGSFNSVDVGIQRQGFELTVSAPVEQINESDLGGESILDMIYLGGNCTLRGESKEYKAGSVAPFWPWGTLGRAFTRSVSGSVHSPVGRMASDIGAAVVLTSILGTPAATKPASLTGAIAILAPGQNGTLMFSPRLRHVPLFLQLLPSVVVTASVDVDYRNFTTT